MNHIPRILFLVLMIVIGLALSLTNLTNTRLTIAEDGELLSEDALIEIAIAVARSEGLISEPTFRFSEYILGREWGPMMTNSIVQYDPDLMNFVVSIEGEFKYVGSWGYRLPDTPEIPLTGITIGLNARTGDLMFVRTAAMPDIDSMTTDQERLVYEWLSQKEWPIFTPVPFDGVPIATPFPWTVTEVPPEVTEEPLQGLPERPDSR